MQQGLHGGGRRIGVQRHREGRRASAARERADRRAAEGHVGTAHANLPRADALIPNLDAIIRFAVGSQVDRHNTGIEVRGIDIGDRDIGVEQQRNVVLCVADRGIKSREDRSIIHRDDVDRLRRDVARRAVTIRQRDTHRARRRRGIFGDAAIGHVTQQRLHGGGCRAGIQRHRESRRARATRKRADRCAAKCDVRAVDTDLPRRDTLITDLDAIVGFRIGGEADRQHAGVQVGGVDVGNRRIKIEDHGRVVLGVRDRRIE